MSEIVPHLSSSFAEYDPGSGSNFSTNGPQNRPNFENSSLNESFAGYVTSFAVYKLLTEIIKPFTSMEAYRAGLIDANGNLLKKDYELVGRESSILSPFTRLVIGIKRLVQALPQNRLRADYNYLSTAARAMAFECKEVGGNSELFLEELEKSLDILFEDGEVSGGEGPGNVIGGGFSNPQVGEPNPALAGFSPPLAFVRRLPPGIVGKKVKLKKKRKKRRK